MFNLLEIGFGNDKSRPKENPNLKIYNKGNIIVSRPQSTKNPYRILSIIEYKSFINEKPKKKLNKSYSKKKHNIAYNEPNKKIKEYKSIKKSVEEMHKKIKKEINDLNEDEELKRTIGYILRNSFTKEELENIIDFGPNPKINRIKMSNIKKNKPIKEKIKPYIPNIENEDQNIINERYLKRTINLYKVNESIVGKINEVIKNSKFINEEKIKKEKDILNLKINTEKKQIRQFIENKKKELKNKIENDEINNTNLNFQLENFNADNIKNLSERSKEDEKVKDKPNKNKKTKNEENISNILKEKKNITNLSKKNNSKIIDKKNNFIKIIDMEKDKKYKDAKVILNRTKKNCEKAEELALEIAQKIKEDNHKIKSPNYETSKKQKNELEEKAKQIIEEVKSNIDGSNFQMNKLNKEEQKLMKGGKRYVPNKKGQNKNKKYIPINKNNEPILLNSINSVKEIKEINKEFSNIFKKNNYMDIKEKDISKKWKSDNECAKAYINNFNKAKKVDINSIKKEKNICLENKNDICNYIYLPGEYDEHWYNNKDTKDKTEYRHPFLIYDD